jgi:hypothetical protein
MAPAGTYIEANGLEIYCETYGEGEPLLLIHGKTATSQSWASHLPAFADHFRVFTVFNLVLWTQGQKPKVAHRRIDGTTGGRRETR